MHVIAADACLLVAASNMSLGAGRASPRVYVKILIGAENALSVSIHVVAVGVVAALARRLAIASDVTERAVRAYS
jgi:hypothetical protein